MALRTMKQVLNKHPIVKGMLAYSITWPTGNIIQQTMAGKRWGKTTAFFKFIHVHKTAVFTHSPYIIFFSHFSFLFQFHVRHHHQFIDSSFASTIADTYDWQKCLQFSLYGSLYVAPTLYGWVRLTSHIWPVTNVRTALMKTLIEQVSYGPTATASFFFIISLLDHKTVEESKQEVVDKFWPTYKVKYIQQKCP